MYKYSKVAQQNTERNSILNTENVGGYVENLSGLLHGSKDVSIQPSGVAKRPRVWNSWRSGGRSACCGLRRATWQHCVRSLEGRQAQPGSPSLYELSWLAGADWRLLGPHLFRLCNPVAWLTWIPVSCPIVPLSILLLRREIFKFTNVLKSNIQ